MLCEHPCRHFDKFSRLDKSLYTGRMAERTSDAIASLSLQELVLLTCHVGTGMNFWTIGQHETQMPCTRKSFCQCPQRFGTKQCGNSFEGYLFQHQSSNLFHQLLLRLFFEDVSQPFRGSDQYIHTFLQAPLDCKHFARLEKLLNHRHHERSCNANCVQLLTA